MDAEAVERVEAELDTFVERQAREKADANKVEEVWRESERVHHQKRLEANRQAWREFHLLLADNHASLCVKSIGPKPHD